MKIILIFLFLFGTFLPLISCRRVPFFRKDYTYIEDFDAFYKMHWDRNGISWTAAFLACDDEGATLFYPKTKGEWSLVKTLAESNDLIASNVTDIFVGIHDQYQVGHFITVDGHQTQVQITKAWPDGVVTIDNDCVLMDIETGTYRAGPCQNDPYTLVPFVCKKVETQICPTIDADYKYIKSLGKCYKVNERKRTWNEAMETCYQEGGMLTAVDTDYRDDMFRAIISRSTNYHIGFRKIIPGATYYNLKGQKLPEEYYDRDRYTLDNECGSIDNGGSLTTHNCYEMLPFICEMEAKI